MSKTLNALKAKYPDRIAEIEDDRGDRNGWWIHLRCGWICTAMETHSIHEDTVMECVQIFNHFVEPCSERYCSCGCEKCKQAMERRR